MTCLSVVMQARADLRVHFHVRPRQAACSLRTCPSAQAAELDEELLAPAPRASTSRAQQQAGRVVALPSAPAASATARRKTKEQLELDLLEAEMAA